MEQDIISHEVAAQGLPPQVRIDFLEERIAKLKIICDQLDPYSTTPEKLVEMLSEFEITDLYDPFQVTNKLLMLMEDSIEELQALQNE